MCDERFLDVLRELDRNVSQLQSMASESMCLPYARLRLYTGCMYSGKTDALIREYKKQIQAGRLVVAFKPRADTRVDGRLIVSRTREAIAALPFGDIDEFVKLAKDCVSSAPPGTKFCFFVDEGQFAPPNFHATVRRLLADGHDVSIAALSGDRHGKGWDTVANLIPICHEIRLLYATCEFCQKPATMSFLRDATPQAQVVIDDGGKKYIPLCLECWEHEQSGEDEMK